MQHKAIRQTMLWLMAGLFLATGCAQPSSEQEPTTGDVQLVGSVPQALTGDNVTRVAVTLTASDVAANTVWLTQTAGVWSGTLYRIPAGPNRTFTAEAFDASGVLRFRGQATGVTIEAGTTQVVALTLQSVDTSGGFDNTVPCIDSLVASASKVLPGGRITLTAAAHDSDATDTLSYAWTTTAGTFSVSTGTSTTWTAPMTAGGVTLTVTVTDSRGASASISVDITVIDTAPDAGYGNATVRVSFNSSPTVRRITTSSSPVAVGSTATLSVQAVDAESDALSYAWSSTCAGTWTDATSAIATFTPSAAPAGDPCGNCPVTVIVTDARGGSTPGTLRLCVGSGPVASFPPRIVLTNQSSESVPGGGSATLRVLAEDGDGSALSFSWAAGVGKLGAAKNSLSSSEILWTAPACSPTGGPPGITATVTNARGFTASYTFYVTVLSGVDCTSDTPDAGAPDAGTGTPDAGSGTPDAGSEPGPVALWTPTGNMLTARYRHSATLLPGGKVLVIGGVINGYALTSAELYDPATGAWTSAKNMAQPRVFHTVTQLPNGKVMVIGGSATDFTDSPLNSAEIYDPATNTWSVAASMTFKRTSHTATLLPNGKVLVIGGGGGGPIPELYDPATNSWLPVASMTSSRSNHFAFLQSNGKVLVLGGGIAAMEVYDPALDLWTTTTASGFSGSWLQAMPQASGRLLLTSGAGFALYDPALYKQTTVGTMLQARGYPQVTRLNSGKLLVTGGNGATSMLSELYDPSTTASSYTASMPDSRYFHTATLLPNGKVLVAGGTQGSGSALNGTLLYTP